MTGGKEGHFFPVSKVTPEGPTSAPQVAELPQFSSPAPVSLPEQQMACCDNLSAFMWVQFGRMEFTLDP